MKSPPTAPTGCRKPRARAILELRLQRLTGPGTRQDCPGADRDRCADHRPARHSSLAGAQIRHRARRAAGGQGSLRRSAPDDDRRARIRIRYRGADPARGHGRHGQPGRRDQARAGLDLPRPTPGRPRPGWHGDPRPRIRSASSSSLRPIRRCCSSRPRDAPISSRSGACRSARRNRAAGRSSICCPICSRAKASRPSCRCPRTNPAGPI